MKVPTSKGIANPAVPESCAVHREVQREALTGVRVGQPLSRENVINSGADDVDLSEGNMCGSDNASSSTTRRGLRTWHVRTLFVRKPGDLPSVCWSSGSPHREGRGGCSR